MELIDKAAVVAEIEKVIDKPAPSHDQQCPWEDGYYCGLYKAESIIDTLEVKEVDLDYIKKELDELIRKPNGDFGWGTLYDVATHFFELGLKAKGE